MSKFTVIQIPLLNLDKRQKLPEGAIDKYWQDLPNLGLSLVKVDLRGAWVEKITESLAELTGLPVARCELVERADGLKMIASPDFLYPNAVEVPGEDLLVKALGENYLYTPEAILSVLDDAEIELPTGFTPREAITKASDLMVGYLIFDSWIGNIDRHAKNWGIQTTLAGKSELLPTYDHGIALGVRMPEDKLPIDINSYSGDMYSSIQGAVGGTLSMDKLANRLLELRPAAAKFWIAEIGKIDRAAIESTFDRIPEEWAIKVSAAFAVDFLEISGKRLAKLVQNQISPPD